jgi:hypothetical protein
MSSLRPDTIRSPTHVQEQRYGKIELWRHVRSRRLYFVTDAEPARAAYAVITRTGRRYRIVAKERLLRDFVRVVSCRCGGHHRPSRAHGALP